MIVSIDFPKKYEIQFNSKPSEFKYPKKLEEKKEEKKVQIFPTVWAVLSLKDVEDLPVVEEVNLKDFIRAFGGRLESNFKAWDEKLKDKETVDVKLEK